MEGSWRMNRLSRTGQDWSRQRMVCLKLLDLDCESIKSFNNSHKILIYILNFLLLGPNKNSLLLQGNYEVKELVGPVGSILWAGYSVTGCKA